MQVDDGYRKGKHRDGYKWVPSALARGQMATWLLGRDKRRKRNPMSTCPVCGPPEVALRPYDMKSCGDLDLCPEQGSSCCRAWADSVVVYCPQCCARFCRQCVKKGGDMADGDSQDSEGNVKKCVRRAERGLDGYGTPTSPCATDFMAAVPRSPSPRRCPAAAVPRSPSPHRYPAALFFVCGGASTTAARTERCSARRAPVAPQPD